MLSRKITSGLVIILGVCAFQTRAQCEPRTPRDPTAVITCDTANLTRTGSPPNGVTWYWQGTTFGTSTNLGSGSEFTVLASGTYYIRARNNATQCWSTTCGSVVVNLPECGERWLPGQIGGGIRAMTTYNGALIVGGDFSSAGGTTAGGIASWNGSEWSSLGDGIDGNVRALAVYDGNLIAAGEFTTAGGVPASNIARWNGSEWAALGAGVSGSFPFVGALTAFEGDLIVGGSFESAGGAQIENIAHWDGAEWHPLGALVCQVNALLVFNNEIVAGGEWCWVRRWNGASWEAMGSGGVTNDVAFALAEYNGDLIAAGESFAVNCVARWTGTDWVSVGGGVSFGMNPAAFALAVFDGDLIVGGHFLDGGGGVDMRRIGRWDGVAWSPMCDGFTGIPFALAQFGPELIAGGSFPSPGLARWTETNGPWIALQPQPQTVEPGETASFTITPAPDYAGPAYQWRRNGVPIKRRSRRGAGRVRHHRHRPHTRGRVGRDGGLLD